MPHPFSTRTFIRCGILTSWRRRRLHKRMPLLRQPINRSTVEKATLRTRRHRPSPAWAFLLVIRQAWPTDNSNRISSIPSISLCLHPVHVHNRHSIVRINRPSKINLRKSKAGDVACSTIFLLLWFSLNTFLDSKRSRKPHIKKPLNAFMIYMKEQRARVIEECTLKESSAINKVLGQKWKELSRTEQDRYYGRRPSFVSLSHDRRCPQNWPKRSAIVTCSCTRAGQHATTTASRRNGRRCLTGITRKRNSLPNIIIPVHRSTRARMSRPSTMVDVLHEPMPPMIRVQRMI